MTFDARISNDPAAQAAFVEWLVSEAASGLSRSRGDRASLRGPLFVYLHRAYEAHLAPDLIGSSEGCVLDRAGLSEAEESAVIGEYEVPAPMIEAMYNDA